MIQYKMLLFFIYTHCLSEYFNMGFSLLLRIPGTYFMLTEYSLNKHIVFTIFYWSHGCQPSVSVGWTLYVCNTRRWGTLGQNMEAGYHKLHQYTQNIFYTIKTSTYKSPSTTENTKGKCTRVKPFLFTYTLSYSFSVRISWKNEDMWKSEHNFNL